jgi:hypothetical protein
MEKIISKLKNATKAQTAIAAALAAFVFGATFGGWFEIKPVAGGGLWMVNRFTSDVYFCRGVCSRVKSGTP